MTSSEAANKGPGVSYLHKSAAANNIVRGALACSEALFNDFASSRLCPEILLVHWYWPRASSHVPYRIGPATQVTE